MSEAVLSAPEVGKEIAGHSKKEADDEHRDRRIAIIEAALLAVVAVLAAGSGYSSAKWSTESRLKLSQASTARTEASSDQLAAMTQRNFDSSTFTAWFVAYVAGKYAEGGGCRTTVHAKLPCGLQRVDGDQSRYEPQRCPRTDVHAQTTAGGCRD